MDKLKKDVYTIVSNEGKNNTGGRIFDAVIVTLILVNVVMAVAETFTLSDTSRKIFTYIEIFSIIIFTFEYILRLWTADMLYPECHI